MGVECVDDTLSVCVVCGDDFTGLLLGIVANLCKAPFETCVSPVETGLHTIAEVAEAPLHSSDAVLLCELVLVAHALYKLLSAAAAVLNGRNNSGVAEVDCVDNALSREAYLTGDVLDSGLNIAAALLKSVEVDIQGLRELADSVAIALHGGLDTIGILVVLELSADSVQLSLHFDALGSSSYAVTVTKAKAAIAEQREEHQISKRVVHSFAHVAIAVVVAGQDSCRQIVIIAAVATINFLNHVTHSFKCLKSC